MHKGVLLIAAMDVLGNLVLTVGQFSVGSGLFQIIYASILVWSAVFSRIFLGRGLSWAQWGAILMIMAGLCVNAVGGQATTSNKATDDRVFAGFFITLLGTCIYSGVYTLNDYMLSGVKRPMSPQQQCLWVGLYSTIVCLLVMTVISVPTLRSMPLENPQVILMYLALIVSALGHNLTYFLLMESTGAVATGE
ncbi:hypothetical protein HKX48_004034 [Thoreauomyces humboldtii]|nr:hypothetical protein HKX48_004034 [Thoreauomyces humboldtii]